MTSEVSRLIVLRNDSRLGGRARFSLIFGALAFFLAVGTLLVFFTPGIRFAAIAPGTDAVINTAATIAAGSVAAFAWLRYRDGGRTDALLQSLAFLTLFLAAALRTGLQITGSDIYGGFSVDAPGQAPVYSWSVARLVSALLLLAGAMSTLDAWSTLRSRTRFLLGLVPLVVLAYSVLVLGIDRWLPVILPPSTLQLVVNRGSMLDSTMISPPLAVLELVTAAIFGLGAAAYARVRQRSDRDDYTGLLSLSLLLAVTTQVHFALVPGAYGDVVTSGDVVRLLFYLLVLLAVATAIRDDLRKLRIANVDLVRLRNADEQRITAEERRRLAREIHDGLVQDLWLARLTSGRIAEVSRIPRDARQMLARLDATLESAQGEARQALITLDGDTETPFGELLRRFVDDYADRFDLDVERDIDAAVEPPTEVQGELLRVCREALNNVRKHADASKVTVALRHEQGLLHLVVRDNGRGFDPAALNGRGFGMESMRQRAQKISARLFVRSQPMDGTTVELELPLATSVNVRTS